ncbi:MAG: hypothetical protein EAZ40_04260 [Rhodobacterales bacterium]|nr:MAG: hypothetical protein EAZ40_04260 [Rhodobacterales bacterium]
MLQLGRSGNFPLASALSVILMALAEANGTGSMWLHAAGALLTLGRVLHPIGLKANVPTHPLRIAGNMGGILATVILIVALARRIIGLSLGGRPLDPEIELVLVTNSHRAGLVNAVRRNNQLPVVLSEGSRTHDVIADHVRSVGTVGAVPVCAWRFLPMPGTTVTLQSGPGSLAHLGDLATYRPKSLGLDPEGFRLYRLHL